MTAEGRLQLFDRLIRASFYALVFFLPISIALVSTFSAFAIFFFLLKRRFRFPPNFLHGPWLAYVAAASVSVLFSQYHSLSVVGFMGKILRGFFLYGAFLEAFTGMGPVRNFIFVWATSAFVTAMGGLCQYFHGFDFLRYTTLSAGRVSSSLRHANDFGAYIISVCPALLGLLLNFKFLKKAERWFFPAVVMVLLWCLGLTMSRGSWVAFFASIVMVGFFKRRALPLIFLLIAGFIAVFSPIMGKTREASLLIDDLKAHRAAQLEEAQNTREDRGRDEAHTAALKPSKPLKPSNPLMTQISSRISSLGTGRWAWWEEAWHIFEAYPLWGAGVNTYSQVGPRYKIDWGGYPHNSYLQMAAEMGLLGLGTFLWLFFVLLRTSFASVSAMPQGYDRALLVGSLGGLSAYMVQSFFDTTFYSVQLSVLLWLMVALIAAIQRVDKTGAPTRIGHL